MKDLIDTFPIGSPAVVGCLVLVALLGVFTVGPAIARFVGDIIGSFVSWEGVLFLWFLVLIFGVYAWYVGWI